MSKEQSVPRLRFPGFNGEWERKRLGDVAKVQGGFAFKSELFRASGVPIVRISNISNSGGIDLEGVVYYDEMPNDSNYLLKYGDLIVAMSGATTGKSCVFNYGEKAYLNQRVGVFRSRSEGLCYTFLVHFFVSNYCMSQMGAVLAAGAQPNISGNDIESFLISLPSLAEQTKIADFLSAVDERLQILKRKKELLETYKKGMMQRLFSQELRFKDADGKDFPDWEERRGNEVFESISDRNHNSDLPILAITQEYGAVPREMIDYQISVTDKSVESYKVVDVGDFIISLRSFQGGIEYSKYRGICSPAYIVLRPTVLINDHFYKNYLKTDGYIQELQAKLEGIRDGKMISYKYFSEIALPFPSLAEQTKIADFLSSLDAKIQVQQGLISRMETWKKGLLQAMFVS